MNIEIQGRFGGGAGFHRTKRPVEALLLAALIVLAGCGGKEEAAPTAAAPATPGAPAGAAAETGSASTVTPASVPQLLASASAAFSADRLVAPAGDNAIEYYLAVLGAEADNVQATQGLVDLFPLGVSIAEKEIAARNVEEATRIVGLLDESSPGSYTVQKLKSRLAATQGLPEEYVDGPFATSFRLEVEPCSMLALNQGPARQDLEIPAPFWDRLYAELCLVGAHARELARRAGSHVH